MNTLNVTINFDQGASTLRMHRPLGLIIEKEEIGKDYNIVEIVSLGSTKLNYFHGC